MTHFKQMIDMLAQGKIKYAQVDHGNSKSTLVLDQGRVLIDFERGKLTNVRVTS